jgi:hypothetical protein
MCAPVEQVVDTRTCEQSPEAVECLAAAAFFYDELCDHETALYLLNRGCDASGDATVCRAALRLAQGKHPFEGSAFHCLGPPAAELRAMCALRPVIEERGSR